ncbi:MAG: hypothetical protein CFE28_08105 [Alphaproteobacteria bacterium PA2]|nr:MAG: hypothetical protein CFE28_08105 [Alphaproteobacteria bacterium PA2]
MNSPFLAIDWGTTNLRAWVVGDDGQPKAHREFPLGVGRLAPGEAILRFADTVQPAMGAEELPAVMCGMIGSNLGWTPVPYLECPASIDPVSRKLHRIEREGTAAWIVPGLRCERPDGGPDVMRGEETHVLGWVAANPSRAQGEHLICHPGTHAKWVRVVDGRIEGFVSCMTGEVFDLLTTHSVLASPGDADNEGAFTEGVMAAGPGDALASRMFTARSRVVGGGMPADHVNAYLSGLLIGSEVASVPGLFGVGPGTLVSVIGDLRLAGRYRRVLELLGYRVEVHDGESAALSGIAALAAGVLAR